MPQGFPMNFRRQTPWPEACPRIVRAKPKVFAETELSARGSHASFCFSQTAVQRGPDAAASFPHFMLHQVSVPILGPENPGAAAQQRLDGNTWAVLGRPGRRPGSAATHPPGSRGRITPIGSRRWTTLLRCFGILENQQLRPPFTSFEVAHGSGKLEGGSNNECQREHGHALDRLKFRSLSLG